MSQSRSRSPESAPTARASTSGPTPTVTRNTHRIQVHSDAASFDMTIENIPSENPKTGRITALSVIAALRKLNAPLRVGT